MFASPLITPRHQPSISHGNRLLSLLTALITVQTGSLFSEFPSAATPKARIPCDWLVIIIPSNFSPKSCPRHKPTEK